MIRRLVGTFLLVVGIAGVFHFRHMLLLMISPPRLNTENVAIVAGPIHVLMALVPVALAVAGVVLILIPRRKAHG